MAADDRLTKSVTQIKDLLPGMKNVTCVFIVIDKGTTNHTKDGSVVRKCRVADRSASICFSLWNEQAAAIEAGDILKLTKGYASLWKGSMVLYSGKYGKLEKIGEFTMVYSETPDMSDAEQEFAQQPQRGQSTSQPPPPPSNGGRGMSQQAPPSNGDGGRGMSQPSNVTGGRGTSSLGNGHGRQPLSASSGNWNGNNHLSDGPGHLESGQPPPPLMGHVTQEPNHLGNGDSHSIPYLPAQKPLVGHFEHSSYDEGHSRGDNYRGGPLRHRGSLPSDSEHYHPYHHPHHHHHHHQQRSTTINNQDHTRAGWR